MYVFATLVQMFARRRWRPALGFGARELRAHLFPTRAEQQRRARRELPYLAIGTVMLNEARDLREWIEFHRLQGVERFFLYDNGSTDNTEEVLQPYLETGLVELTTWRHSGDQLGAIAEILRRYRDRARWIAVIDVDEFLFCPTGERVCDVLREFESYPAVAVHWNIFGTADVDRRGVGDEVLRTFTRRSADFGPRSANTHVKSIVDPWCTFAARPPTPHHQPYRVGFAVNEIGAPAIGPRPWPVRCDRLRINHYWSKSKAESLRKFAQRSVSTAPRFSREVPLMRDLIGSRLNAVQEHAILDVMALLRDGRHRARPPQRSFSNLRAAADLTRFSLGVARRAVQRYGLRALVQNGLGGIGPHALW